MRSSRPRRRGWRRCRSFGCRLSVRGEATPSPVGSRAERVGRAAAPSCVVRPLHRRIPSPRLFRAGCCSLIHTMLDCALQSRPSPMGRGWPGPLHVLRPCLVSAHPAHRQGRGCACLRKSRGILTSAISWQATAGVWRFFEVDADGHEPFRGPPRRSRRDKEFSSNACGTTTSSAGRTKRGSA